MLADQSFSYITFIADPLKSLSFLFLIFTMISFWMYKKVWIWVPILFTACSLAYFAKILDLEILLPVFLLFFCYFSLKSDIGGFGRLFICIITAALSLGFSLHLFPDIHNWFLASNVQLSSDAPSFNYYWNFDKPFIGLFVLAFHVKLIKNKQELIPVFWKTAFFAICFLVLFIGACLSFDLVRFDFKFPMILFPWLIGNLFFVVIPEECFFRGFLQEEIRKAIPHKWAPIFAIFLVSLVFALFHIFFLQNFTYIALAFVASFAYGYIFHLTKSIESAIFTHYFLNVVHFIFFTYPILISAS